MVYAAMREQRAKRAAERQSTGVHTKGYTGPRGAELEWLRANQRSPRPDTPCLRCGDAGYCQHRPAPVGVSHGSSSP